MNAPSSLIISQRSIGPHSGSVLREFSMSLFSNPSVALLDRLTGIATFLSAIAILATMALAV